MADDDNGTIVVVEDEPAIADLLDVYLRRAGFRVVLADNTDRGAELCASEQPRLVILDIGLPGTTDGLGLCRQIRDAGTTPVMLLTARDSEVDRIVGLELGADDYVTKPFSPREVVARVKAILRRSDAGPTKTTTLTHNELSVDLTRREARAGGAPVVLTAREFDLLVYFLRHEGAVLGRQQLLDGVWGSGWYGDERTVDVHVRQLRRKLGPAFDLTTIWGVGYRLS
ncbi:MAG: response regulator transcription factor [Actinobacteria bacterium]|nr:response regulator transcription factor [Actinomycetota bacterium]MBA3654812.1 response regulator transcription factor [Actinomycetota bacterium]